MKTTTMMAMAVLLLGCGTGKKVTERMVRETDSTAVWELKDSLQRKVTEIALLKTDLQRMWEENVTLQSEEMTVETLTKENRKLKEKTDAHTLFNVKLLLAGILIGTLLTGWLMLRRK